MACTSFVLTKVKWDSHGGLQGAVHPSLELIIVMFFGVTVGLEWLKTDAGLFIYKEGNQIVIAIIYVNNVLFCGPFKSLNRKSQGYLHKKMGMLWSQRSYRIPLNEHSSRWSLSTYRPCHIHDTLSLTLALWAHLHSWLSNLWCYHTQSVSHDLQTFSLFILYIWLWYSFVLLLY